MANRIIKFRFWNKKDYGSNGDSFYQPANSMVEWENAKDDPNKWINFEDENVLPMQFTGLKDKNGKEIYEGDIIQMWVGTKPVTVGNITWGGWQYVVRMEVVGKDKTNYFGYNSEDIDPEKIEIIGNIYENPELINN